MPSTVTTSRLVYTQCVIKWKDKKLCLIMRYFHETAMQAFLSFHVITKLAYFIKSHWKWPDGFTLMLSIVQPLPPYDMHSSLLDFNYFKDL